MKKYIAVLFSALVVGIVVPEALASSPHGPCVPPYCETVPITFALNGKVVGGDRLTKAIANALARAIAGQSLSQLAVEGTVTATVGSPQPGSYTAKFVINGVLIGAGSLKVGGSPPKSATLSLRLSRSGKAYLNAHTKYKGLKAAVTATYIPTHGGQQISSIKLTTR